MLWSHTNTLPKREWIKVQRKQHQVEQNQSESKSNVYIQYRQGHWFFSFDKASDRSALWVSQTIMWHQTGNKLELLLKISLQIYFKIFFCISITNQTKWKFHLLLIAIKSKKKKLASHYNSSWRRCSQPAQTVKLPDLISVCEDTKTVSPCNQPAALHKLEKTTGASFPLWRCHLRLIDAGLVLCLQPWFHPKVWPDSCWSPLLIWPHPRPPPAFFTASWLMYFCPWELLRADWRHTFGRNSIDGVYLCWCFHVVKHFSIAIRSPPEEKKKKRNTHALQCYLGLFPNYDFFSTALFRFWHTKFEWWTFPSILQ